MAIPEFDLDQIRITGLTGFGYHGVLPSERATGQTFTVDLTLHLDLAPAGASDDLRDTVDYSAIGEQVVAEIEDQPVALIEALAERIARTCLAEAGVAAAEVTVHKPQAPMPVPFQDVMVTVKRSKR